MLFRLWRGSIIFKLVIPANKFIRGKLRVFFREFPDTSEDLDVVSNNSLSMVIDVTASTEVEICVPWTSHQFYKTIAPLNTTTNLACNGFLHVRVEEPLLVQNPNYQQKILIYARAGNDFELALADPKNIQNINYDIVSTTIPTAQEMGARPVVNLNNYKPVSADSNIRTYDLSTFTSLTENDNNPLLTIVHNILPDSKLNDEASMIHMGERYNSFRTILKKFYFYNRFRTSSNVTSIASYFVPYLPIATTEGPVIVDRVSNTRYFVRSNTPVQHLSKMFAGMRGSTRYAIYPSRYPNTPQTTIVNRAFGQEPYVYSHFQGRISDTQCFINQSIDGKAVYKQSEPIVFDIPFQNFHWFYPTKKRPISMVSTVAAGGIPNLSQDIYGVFVSQLFNSADYYDIHSSIGEDFTFCIYNGPPIIAKAWLLETFNS